MADDLLQSDDVMELSLEETSWAPPPGVFRHSGLAIEPEQDFFADPNPEIGEIITADSNLAVTRKPWRRTSRFVVAGLVGWASSMIVHYAAKSDPIVEAVVFAVISLMIWLLLGYSYKCSYVGTRGVCRYKCKGHRSRYRETDLFLFEDAAELRTSQTRHYHNGIYTGTAYSFTWTDDEGRKRFKLSGTYRGEKKPPKPKDAFHFAVSAERAWTLHVLQKLSAQMDEHGLVTFPLSGKDWVAVGRGYLQIFRKGQIERLDRGEIGEVSIDAGVVKIKRVDAKEGWFSSTGVHSFPSNSMANFQAFSLAYARWVVGSNDGESAGNAPG